MALLSSEMVSLKTPLHPFSLPDVDGKIYTQDYFSDAKVSIVVFMCNHCPYVKATIERLAALYEDYKSKGVKMLGINSNDAVNYPEDDFEQMKIFSQEKRITFPYLCDETQEVAKVYHAVCTPDIFVYDNNHLLAYRGRLDDNWQNPDQVRSHDLQNALENLLCGHAPSSDQYPSMGCSIKWKVASL